MNAWNVKGCHVKARFDLVSDTSEVRGRTCLVFYTMISSSFRDDRTVWWTFPKGRILNL